ncbi:hypothetical protein RRG08_016214 [Elysia crispata]|uniref:Uncharacterized protein n=1 Tax=Elysia crispata TaxID=231223 RepID=A0AAE0ZQF6_9GAST|nr:hypothetical protein RRG08_016214 [Elysia crispata]
MNYGMGESSNSNKLYSSVFGRVFAQQARKQVQPAMREVARDCECGKLCKINLGHEGKVNLWPAIVPDGGSCQMKGCGWLPPPSLYTQPLTSYCP